MGLFIESVHQTTITEQTLLPEFSPSFQPYQKASPYTTTTQPLQTNTLKQQVTVGGRDWQLKES
jgi:hypothetical protein